MSATTITTPLQRGTGHHDQPAPQRGVDEASHPALDLAHGRVRRCPGHRLHRRRRPLTAQPGHSMTAQQYQSFDATSASLFGVIIVATLLGALAVRTVTAEYATGMIRSTFTAMPARRLVLAAKAATVAAFVFPIALLVDIAGFRARPADLH